MKRRSVKFAVLGLVACAVFGGSWFLLQHLNPGNVAEGALRSQGWPLALGMTGCMMLAGGFGVPPVLFVLPAAAIWSLPVAGGVCLVGGMGASIFGFLLARYGFRERIVSKIPPKIQKFESRLETHAFSTVFVLRLLFYLFPPINWMLGMSRIPLHTFIIATFLGMLPATFAYLWAGQGLLGFLLGLPPAYTITLLSGALLLILLWLRWVISPRRPPV